MNQRGFDLIKKWEGCKLKAYKCPSGVWTIGYGNTFYYDGSPVQEGDEITQADAEILFRKVVEEFEQNVKRLLPYTLPQDAIDACVSLAYNIGLGAFNKSTVLKRIKNDPKDFDGIEAAFLMWVKSKGKTLQGLVSRRHAEFNLYRDGILGPYTKPEVFELGRKYPKK